MAARGACINGKSPMAQVENLKIVRGVCEIMAHIWKTLRTAWRSGPKLPGGVPQFALQALNMTSSMLDRKLLYSFRPMLSVSVKDRRRGYQASSFSSCSCLSVPLLIQIQMISDSLSLYSNLDATWDLRFHLIQLGRFCAARR